MVGVIDLDVAEVKAGLDGGQFLLIDVREPHEYAARSVAGTVNLPLSTFDPAALPAAGEKEIVFMCAGGVRSRRALEACQAAGLPLSKHLAGGIGAWVAAGAPVV